MSEQTTPAPEGRVECLVGPDRVTVQACRPADRAMLQTDAGRALLAAAVKMLRAEAAEEMSRALFEAYLAQHQDWVTFPQPMFRRDDDGTYWYSAIEHAWSAWKEAALQPNAQIERPERSAAK